MLVIVSEFVECILTRKLGERFVEKFGISVALLTPFTVQGKIDAAMLGTHATHMLDEGVESVTLYGTTGEGASIGRGERKVGIEAILSAGISADRLILGICSTALEDAVEQVAEGQAYGVDCFLLMPPFYFKDCSDDALFDWHMQLLARTDTTSQFIIYHIPQVSGVALSVDLVSRLAAAAPTRFRAVKDSSGCWENATALLAQKAMPVLIGDERLLHRALPLGADGSICGFANLYPARLARLVNTAIEDAALCEEVTQVVSRPVVPALKALMSVQHNNPTWEQVRLPLARLPASERRALLASVCTDVM
jgi:4-hydroxy-tetrahydrodipicolinate synthase